MNATLNPPRRTPESTTGILASIPELCQHYGAAGYYADPAWLIGIPYRGMVLWHRWAPGTGYVPTIATGTGQGHPYRHG